MLWSHKPRKQWELSKLMLLARHAVPMQWFARPQRFQPRPASEPSTYAASVSSRATASVSKQSLGDDRTFGTVDGSPMALSPPEEEAARQPDHVRSRPAASTASPLGRDPKAPSEGASSGFGAINSLDNSLDNSLSGSLSPSGGTQIFEDNAGDGEGGGEGGGGGGSLSLKDDDAAMLLPTK